MQPDLSGPPIRIFGDQTDPHIVALSPWQQHVYDLCNEVGISKNKAASEELERPVEYEDAFQVWSAIMLETLY